MELSVIIPTYNRAEPLRRTLQGFCDQIACDRIGEILVVNDGSTDATPEVVDQFSSRLPVRHIPLPKSNVSAARNRGLREARGIVALMLDDDVVPSSRLVIEHTDFHRQNPELESVLQGYVTWLPELPISPFMRWYGEHAIFLYALIEDGARIDWRFMYTCNISFKTEFLCINGGLNEKLSMFEDRELGYRLEKKGLRMFFRRSALGYHNQTFTFQQACDRMQRYSKGFSPFLATEAGSEMAKIEARLQSPFKRLVKRIIRRPFSPLRPLMDSDYRLPDSVYWFFYGAYAIQPDWESVIDTQEKH